MEEAGEGICGGWYLRQEREGFSYHQQWVSKKEELCKRVGWIEIPTTHFIINKSVISFKSEVGEV